MSVSISLLDVLSAACCMLSLASCMLTVARCLLRMAEAEVCFYIISGLFKHLTPEQTLPCSKAFAERLTQNTQANVAQRIKILGNLYNLMEDECALR